MLVSGPRPWLALARRRTVRHLVTTDLLDLIRSALAGSYVLERELSGGAMARVFLATEPALGRRVVVKLLPPELTGAVSIERFRREVLVTASLQHPFVVPVLAAGEAAGFPFYTMPFVEGESLRGRLRRDGRLPAVEAVGILRDIAAALAHAHSRGVVHRDLKPENVLLSGGHAVVTDFGVAKALSAATGRSEGTLTSVGIALGTPAYMAPEQAAADPNTDHRADLYTLGVIAYELITGRGPFGARTPQQMVAAHLTESPVHIKEVQPSCDSDLAELVMRLLEKDPAARPQRSEEIVRQLTVAGGRAATSPRDRLMHGRVGRRAAAVSLGVVLAAAGLTVAIANSTKPDPVVLRAPRVVVLPFENRSGDSVVSSVARMVSEWVTHGIRESGAVDVVEPSTVRAGTEEPAAIAARVEAGFVIAGSVYRAGDTVHLSARIIDASSREVVGTVPDASAAISAPMPAIDAVRRRILGALASTVDPTINQFARIASQPPSFEAYREYVEARSAIFRGDPRLALRHARRALALDSTFTLPYVVATFAHANLGECHVTDSLVRALDPRRNSMPTFDRLQIDRISASCSGDRQAAYRAAVALRRFAPRSAQTAEHAAFEALRVGRFRESVATYDSVSFDHPSIRESPFILANYAAALHWTGNFERALERGREGQGRFPAEASMVIAQLAALAGLGRTDEVLRRLREVQDASSLSDSALGDVFQDVAAELEVHGHDSESRTACEMAFSWYSARAEAAWARDGPVSCDVVAGRWEEVYELCTRIVRREPQSAWGRYAMGARGVAAVRLKLTTEADSIEAALTQRADGGARYWLALMSAHAGDKATAVTRLRDALTHGFTYDLWQLHAEPMLGPLRGYLAFEALVAARN